MAAQTPTSWITSLVFPSLEVMKTPQPHVGPQHPPLANGLVNGTLRHENEENGVPNVILNGHDPNLQNNEVGDPARNIPFSFPGVPEPLEAMMEVREKGEDEEMELMSKKLGDMST
ncbi:hypothetical protein C7M84_009556 [Penaeus vannamei]|uniref:Uncharacterized protein n=1 Tax=Penaeus vannamei TaxID=6689 RepID=A0A3R7SRN9_PENVA|nr:hypothetical protein C7M84_009556 [Penaeus vannamei]